ncbi:MAG: hypothetical protein BGO26_00110 [Actinobacteria bacterium 69-20]|jgi:hypothetical protein|nr:MAG: hypothetical protein BGO26_00110 [Actinobacteria bacterium 69-20]
MTTLLTTPPTTITPRYTVTAVYRGDLVYLSSNRYPRTELLRLHHDPVTHDEAEAHRLAAMGRQDEALTHVLVDQDPDTTGLTLDTVITGTTWRGTLREAIQATQPDVYGTVVQIMERFGRLPETDDEVDPLDVAQHMTLDDVRLLLDDPGALIAGVTL